SQVDGQAVNVPCPRPGSGSQDHFVAAKVGHDFFDQWIYGTAAAIHNALATNLHHIDPGQNGDVGRVFCSFLDRRIRQRAGYKLLSQIRKKVVLVVYRVFHRVTFNFSCGVIQNTNTSNSKLRFSLTPSSIDPNVDLAQVRSRSRACCWTSAGNAAKRAPVAWRHRNSLAVELTLHEAACVCT